MRVLITGHKGFVGRHFCRYFEYFGDSVVGIDLKDGDDCRGYFNGTNKKLCDRISSSKFDLVIHLAAIVGGRETIEKEPLIVATDLAVDSEFFNWAMRTHQERVIYFSSSAAYPIELQQVKNHRRLKESDIDLSNISNPDMTYGWSKLTGEYLAQFLKKSGTKVHIFRPFSGYGEGQDMNYPLPSLIGRGLRKENPFIIWGDGTQVRDFIHIDDIIRATMRAVELEIEGPINLGSGTPMSFRDLAQKIVTHMKYKPKFEYRLDKPSGCAWRCSNNAQMLNFYTPQISIEEGIQRISKYYESILSK